MRGGVVAHRSKTQVGLVIIPFRFLMISAPFASVSSTSSGLFFCFLPIVCDLFRAYCQRFLHLCTSVPVLHLGVIGLFRIDSSFCLSSPDPASYLDEHLCSPCANLCGKIYLAGSLFFSSGVVKPLRLWFFCRLRLVVSV